MRTLAHPPGKRSALLMRRGSTIGEIGDKLVGVVQEENAVEARLELVVFDLRREITMRGRLETVSNDE